MTEAEERVPCPHPIAFRGGADCHLCGNSGFVLLGSRWTPQPNVAAATEDRTEDRSPCDASAVPIPASENEPPFRSERT
jgi:hypothetical protein